MRMVHNVALAIAAAGALALGSAALAQEAQKPESKPQSQPQHAEQHRGEHRQHGKNRMREMRDGCHGDSRGAAEKHEHS